MNGNIPLFKNPFFLCLVFMMVTVQTKAETFEVIDPFAAQIVEVVGVKDRRSLKAAYTVAKKKIEAIHSSGPVTVEGIIIEGVALELAEKICLSPINYCKNEKVISKCVGVASFDYLVNGQDRFKFSFSNFNFEKEDLKIVFNDLICTDSEDSLYKNATTKSYKAHFANFLKFGFNPKILDHFVNSPLNLCDKVGEDSANSGMVENKKDDLNASLSPAQTSYTGWRFWPFGGGSTVALTTLPAESSPMAVEEKKEGEKNETPGTQVNPEMTEMDLFEESLEDDLDDLDEINGKNNDSHKKGEEVSSQSRSSYYYDTAASILGKVKYVAEGSITAAAQNVSKGLFKEGFLNGLANASWTNVGALAITGLSQHVMQRVAELTFMNDEAVNWPSILDGLKVDLLGPSSELTDEQKRVAGTLIEKVEKSLEEFKNNFDKHLETFLKSNDQPEGFNIQEAIKQAQEASLASFPPLSLIESSDEVLYQHIYALLVLKSLAGKTMPVSIKRVNALMKPDKFLGSISYFNGLKGFAQNIQKASIPHNYEFDKKVGLAISKAGTGKTYSLQHDVKNATGLKLLLIPGETLFNLKYPSGEAAYDYIVSYIVKRMRETFWYPEEDANGNVISVPARNGILVFDDLDSIFSDKGPFAESNPVARKRFLELIKNFGDINVTKTFEIDLLDGVEEKLKGKRLDPIRFAVDGRKISVAITFNEPPKELNPDNKEEIKKLNNESESEFKARVQLITAIKSRIINLGVKYPDREDRMRVGMGSIGQLKKVLTEDFPLSISKALLEHPAIAKDFKFCEEKLEQMVDADMTVVNTRFNGEKGIRTFDVMLNAFQSRLNLTAAHRRNKIGKIIGLEVAKTRQHLIEGGMAENDKNFKSMVFKEVSIKLRNGDIAFDDHLMTCSNTDFEPQVYIESSVEYSVGKDGDNNVQKNIEAYENSVQELAKTSLKGIGWQEKQYLGGILEKLNRTENKGDMNFFQRMKGKFDEILLNRPQFPDGRLVARKIAEEFKTIRTELPDDPFDKINDFVETIYDGIEAYYSEEKPRNYQPHEKYLVKYETHHKNDELVKIADALEIPVIKISNEDLGKNIPVYAAHLKSADLRKTYLVDAKDKDKLGDTTKAYINNSKKYFRRYEWKNHVIYYSRNNASYHNNVGGPQEPSVYSSPEDVYLLYPAGDTERKQVQEGKFDVLKVKAAPGKTIAQVIQDALSLEESKVVEGMIDYLNKKIPSENGLSKNAMFILESNSNTKSEEIKYFLKAMDELNNREKANFLTMVIDDARTNFSFFPKRDLELDKLKKLVIPGPQVQGRKVGAEAWMKKALENGGEISKFEQMVLDILYDKDFELAVEYQQLFKEQLPSDTLLNGVGEIVGPNIVDNFWGEEAVRDILEAKERMLKNLEKEQLESGKTLEEKAREKADAIFKDKWEKSIQKVQDKKEELERQERAYQEMLKFEREEEERRIEQMSKFRTKFGLGGTYDYDFGW